MHDFSELSRSTIFLLSAGVVIALAGLGIDLLRKRKRDRAETFGNILVYAGHVAVNFFFGYGAKIFVLFLLEKFAVARLPGTVPVIAACFLLVDFLFYWRHRWEHTIQLLWAQHSVHHSSVEMNFSTAIRVPWISPTFVWLIFCPLVLLGFPAWMVISSYSANLFYQFFVHNEEIKALGFLERIVVTPSNHRVHHGRNELYLDKNFGGVFIFWDVIFGTYQPETEKVEYGVRNPVLTKNPLLINVIPFFRLWNGLRAAKGRHKIRVLFGPPTI